MSAATIIQDLLDFLVTTSVEDLGDLGPTGIFAFVQEHRFLNLGDMKDAQEVDSARAELPNMTPAKRKQDLESPNGTFSTLTDTIALLKDEILVVIGHVKSLGAGSLVGSRAREAEDGGDKKDDFTREGTTLCSDGDNHIF